jgi:hypothetical protein
MDDTDDLAVEQAAEPAPRVIASLTRQNGDPGSREEVRGDVPIRR